MLNDKEKRTIKHIFHTGILVLSAALIAFISYEVFNNVDFLHNRLYMDFQLFVCVFFITDYFVEVWMAERRWHCAMRKILFLIISIPYLNIIDMAGIEVSREALYYIRFIPMIRGAWAMAIVVSYVSTNRIIGIFASYLSILVLTLYFAALIFYAREQPVNPGVPTFWSSLWWCSLEMTTFGAPVNPFTPTGKVIGALLSCMGMIMFPLFTVYLTQIVRRYLKDATIQDTPQPTDSTKTA